jgi:glycine/D-amino acid oxidase-like deaminating enzyme
MEYDFLIIGGGVAGVSLAGRLAGAAKVGLLEAEAHLAWHASSRSAALFEASYGLPPVVELSMASEPYYRAAEGVLRPRGMMIVGKAGDQAAFDADCAAMALDPMDFEAARSVVPILNPDTVAYVALASHAWDIDTDLYLQRFAKLARVAGTDILLKAPVTAIEKRAGGWQVTTPQGVLTAKVIVNAAGAWVDRVAAMAGVRPLGFTPLRRSMARIPAPGGHDISRWPMIFGAAEAWYCKPDAGALLVSPAEQDLVEPHDAFADDMVLAEGLARYEEMVTEPVTRMLASWAGLRTFAPDRVLVIGQDVAEPGFFWLGGQGGYGFQTSPAASQLAADLLLCRTPELGRALVNRLSPRRFA